MNSENTGWHVVEPGVIKYGTTPLTVSHSTEIAGNRFLVRFNGRVEVELPTLGQAKVTAEQYWHDLCEMGIGITADG
jgi:hypothetical protein